MGDINQSLFMERFASLPSGPVVEIGSKDYGNTTSFRESFPGREYVGIDMAEGKGVDLVLDLTLGTASLPHEHFGLAICCSVLEHVRKPWVFAEHLSSLVAPDGYAYIAVPWVWRYHAYPDDYFRYSWRGVSELFPGFDWLEIAYSTTVTGEFYIIDDENKSIDDQLAQYQQVPGGPRKFLPYLQLHMFGRKLNT